MIPSRAAQALALLLAISPAAAHAQYRLGQLVYPTRMWPKPPSHPAVPQAAPSPPSPLPPTMETPSRPGVPPGEEDFGLDVVLFAGRTVEFHLPRGWTVKEVPVGREVRLLVGPGDLPDEPEKLIRGVWLTYHRRTDPAPSPPLAEELQYRVTQASDPRAHLSGPPQKLTVSGHPGLKQNLEVPPDESNRWLRRISHIVAKTPWGLLELRGTAPVDYHDDVRAGLALILSSLELHAPASPPDPKAPGSAAAQKALGSWKGVTGRLHLSGDGRVELEFDRVATFNVHHQGKVQFSRPGDRLRGRFDSQGDLIFVTWEDGSRLNYRWKLHQGDLLLTDHTGRVSQLKRLFESN